MPKILTETKQQIRDELTEDILVVKKLQENVEDPPAYIALEKLLVYIKQLRAEV